MLCTMTVTINFVHLIQVPGNVLLLFPNTITEKYNARFRENGTVKFEDTYEITECFMRGI